jgi:hypothetical protein
MDNDNGQVNGNGLDIGVMAGSFFMEREEKNSGEDKDSAKKSDSWNKEEEQKKELEEVKKEVKSNASKYKIMQTNMMLAQSQSMLKAIPFIVAGILVLLVIVKNGGKWLQGGLQFVIGGISGK